MLKKLTSNQMKYLMTWINMDKARRSFTNVSMVMGVTKSAVQQTMSLLVKRGFLDSSYFLTEEGKEYVTWYKSRLQALNNWLQLHKIDEKTAEETAYNWMADTHKSVIDMLVRECMVCSICRSVTKDTGKEAMFEGIDLSTCIPEGIYDVEVDFYKENLDDNYLGEPSMADKAFKKDAHLIVAKGHSMIQLNRIRIFQMSFNNRDMLSGKMKTMDYIVKGMKKRAEIQRDMVNIPTSDIQWYCSRNKLKLTGKLRVFFTCTAGPLHMPRRPAVLYVRISQEGENPPKQRMLKK